MNKRIEHMNGRKIKSILFENWGQNVDPRLIADEARGITFEAEVDHQAFCYDFWIVEKLNGVEISRINPKYVQVIEWEPTE